MVQNRGWLTNPERRERKNRSLSFTEKDVKDLITKIEAAPNYISETLSGEVDRLFRLRDKAIISTGWIWFKRAGEILGVKRKDVVLTDTEILVTFHIQKKSKRFKICPVCEAKGKTTRSGYRAKFCRECKTDIQYEEVQGEKQDFIKTKRKTLRNYFVKYILEWLEAFDSMELMDPEEAWFFPSFQVVFNSGFFKFYSEKPMTVQNLDAILQKLDFTITSSFFRYFQTERYLSLGYLPHELKEIGDWSSSKMPEIYAERMGLTPTLRKWSEDVR